MKNRIDVCKSLAKSDELTHYGVIGMHWGIRRYQPYGSGGYIPNSAKAISSIAKTKEPRITKDVLDAFNKCGMKSYGLENRLKTKDSIQRKIEADIAVGDKKIIKDAIRYTGLSNNNNYVSNYFAFKEAMKRKGYTETICKNFFKDYKEGKVKHKAVQSVFVDKDGFPFEIQFHTKESQKAKDLKVPLYEEVRKIGTTNKRSKQIEAEMIKLAEEVPYPDRIMEIKSHK